MFFTDTLISFNVSVSENVRICFLLIPVMSPDFNAARSRSWGCAPIGAILFYCVIKEYAEKDARLLASHRLWQWLVPFTPAIQAALAKLGLKPSNIPRLIGLSCLRYGGVTREERSMRNNPFKQRGTDINCDHTAIDVSAYVRNLFRALAPHRRDN